MNSIPLHHINFREPGPSAKDSFSLNYFWIIAIIALFCVAASSYAFLQLKRVKSMQAKIDNMNAEITRIKGTRSKLEADLLSGKALKEVLKDPVIWSTLVNKITNRVPDSIKLNEISGSILEKRTLTIKGTSPYLLPIFKLKKSLAGLSECEKAALISVQQSRDENGHENILFHLECRLL